MIAPPSTPILTASETARTDLSQMADAVIDCAMSWPGRGGRGTAAHCTSDTAHDHCRHRSDAGADSARAAARRYAPRQSQAARSAGSLPCYIPTRSIRRLRRYGRPSWQSGAMTAGETDREMCVRHVAEQEQRIVRQEALIERLRKAGAPLLEDARKLLIQMQDLLGEMRAHVARLSN